MAVDPGERIFNGPGFSDPAHASNLADRIHCDPPLSGDGGLEPEIAAAQ